jgi:hypothetical protein
MKPKYKNLFLIKIDQLPQSIGVDIQPKIKDGPVLMRERKASK